MEVTYYFDRNNNGTKLLSKTIVVVAQMVEYNLAKVTVASSNLVDYYSQSLIDYKEEGCFFGEIGRHVSFRH